MEKYQRFDRQQENHSNQRNFRKSNKKSTCAYALLSFLLIVVGLIIIGFYFGEYNEHQFEVFKKLKIEINVKDNKEEIKLELKHKKFSIHHKIENKTPKKHKQNSHSILDFLWGYSRYNKQISIEVNKNKIYLSKKNSFDFKVTRIDGPNVDCFSINVTNQENVDDPVVGCFSLNSNYWYGGHESLDQPYWPINNMSYDYKAYVSGYPDPWGAVLERYWLSSQGIAIHMDESVPLFVQHINQNEICLMSNRKQLPYSNTPNYYPDNKLSYTMCSGPDIRTLHLYMINTFIGLPKSYPDEIMIKYPIWTTWAYFFRNINQTVVLDFAQQIAANGYSRSQLEIDDQWEVYYGDLDFDKQKFPNMRILTNQLHNLGFRVTLWVHPFCNIDSPNFINGTQNGYWIRDPTGQFPALTSWWNGRYAAIIDTTNPNASDYFIEKLNNLKSAYGVDSFKFDAGESSWTPAQYKFYDSQANPNSYSTNYVRIAAKMGNFIEVRTGTSTQDLGIFYRMLDRATNWSIDDGLKSVVTVALQFGILGYINVLPDIIFGNAGPDQTQKELFIRWTQLTAFLPVMQFGTPPWFFDKQTNEICLNMTRLHESLAPYIISQTRNLDGSPIIRPMWWNSEDALNNPQVYTMTDEFMVGDNIIVAPILDPGLNQRDIWLPSGSWIDQLTMNKYTGPLWIRNYPIVLENIPYFFRENSSI